MSTIETGKLGEELAAEFLESNGVLIKEKNFRTRYGEIDIVGDDHGTVVIIEVRAKKNEYSGLPIETVNYKKQQKVLKMAKWYLMEKKIAGNARIDVLGITFTRPPQFQWIKNAIEDN